MLNIVTPLAASLLPLSLVFGAAATIGSNGAQDGIGAPEEIERPAPKLPRCEIRVDYERGSVVLEGIVFARGPVSGSYQMRVSQTGGAGSSEITQSGEFAVSSGSTGSLGVVSLSNRAGGYVARLRVQWKGGTVDCTGRARGGERPAEPKVL